MGVVVLYLYPFDTQFLSKGGKDKIVHFIIFTLLGFMGFSINKLFFIITVLMGGILEIAQKLSPPRNFEIMDAFFNILGSIVGAIIYKIKKATLS